MTAHVGLLTDAGVEPRGMNYAPQPYTRQLSFGPADSPEGWGTITGMYYTLEGKFEFEDFEPVEMPDGTVLNLEVNLTGEDDG